VRELLHALSYLVGRSGVALLKVIARQAALYVKVSSLEHM